MSTQAIGQHAEDAALDYLQRAGLKLVARNFSSRTGEIDLIMKHRTPIQGSVVVFIEVRYRKHSRYGGAAASVTQPKQARIVRTARRFLQTHPRYARYPSRFDIIAITGSITAPAISWIKGAFDC